MEHTASIIGLLQLNEHKEFLTTLSVLIFIGTYAMIIAEKFFHRVPASLIGGFFAVFIGLITPEQAWHSIDHNTIFLLLGMMIMVSILIESGFFSILSQKALKITEGNPLKILLIFTSLTAFLSAFLDNVTTVLFMVPILISLTAKLRLNPVPYIIATVLASNIGGTATLIGDPPNIIIGSIGKLNFMDFVLNLAPIIVFTYILGTLVFVLYMKFMGHLNPSPLSKEEIKNIIEQHKVEYDVILMRKGLIIFLITIFLFFIHHLIGLEAGVIALFMSSVLLLWTREDPERIFERVEWSTLIFFMGLFVVIGAMEHNEVFEDLAKFVSQFLFNGNELSSSATFILGFLSAIISGIVDNIPFTMAMAKVLADLENIQLYTQLWWALALGACLGGNLTIIGASANVVASGLAEKEGYPIKFWDFVKMGTPVTIITVIFALTLLWLKYEVLLKP